MGQWNYLAFLLFGDSSCEATTFKYDSSVSSFSSLEFISMVSIRSSESMQVNVNNLISNIKFDIADQKFGEARAYSHIDATSLNASDETIWRVEKAVNLQKHALDLDLNTPIYSRMEGTDRAALAFLGSYASHSTQLSSLSSDTPANDAALALVGLTGDTSASLFVALSPPPFGPLPPQFTKMDVSAAIDSETLISEQVITSFFDFTRILTHEEQASCSPRDGGSYEQCQVALNRPVHALWQALALDSTETPTILDLSKIQDLDETFSPERTEQVCGLGSEAHECLQYTLAHKLSTHAAKLAKNPRVQLNFTSNDWPQGQALLHFSAQQPLSQPFGIKQANSSTWLFAPPSSTVGSLTNSHRALGGLILLVLFGVFGYLLMGSERRQRISQWLTSKRGWTKLPEQPIEMHAMA